MFLCSEYVELVSNVNNVCTYVAQKKCEMREVCDFFFFNPLVELYAYCGNVIVWDSEIILKKSFVC